MLTKSQEVADTDAGKPGKAASTPMPVTSGECRNQLRPANKVNGMDGVGHRVMQSAASRNQCFRLTLKLPSSCSRIYSKCVSTARVNRAAVAKRAPTEFYVPVQLTVTFCPLAGEGPAPSFEMALSHILTAVLPVDAKRTVVFASVRRRVIGFTKCIAARRLTQITGMCSASGGCERREKASLLKQGNCSLRI